MKIMNIRSEEPWPTGCGARASRSPHRRGNREQGGFSLVEVLLVATIMSVIVYGLYSMFDQTQKALRSNTTQVDVLEAGRAAMELISRDVEQSMASQVWQATNVMVRLSYPNKDYSVALRPYLLTNQSPQRELRRTNFLQDLLFLTRYKDNWCAGGYFIGGNPTNSLVVVTNGIGTLYRFSVIPEPPIFRLNTNLLIQFARLFDFRTNANPVMDGVVHFSLKAYDPAGVPLELAWNSTYAGYNILKLSGRQALPANFGPYNLVLQQEPYLNYQTRVMSLNNALPAYLEVELGILEPQALERVKGFLRMDRQRQYIEQHAGQVHLFRKRIPIRSATQ